MSSTSVETTMHHQKSHQPQHSGQQPLCKGSAPLHIVHLRNAILQQCLQLNKQQQHLPVT
jgi:hypothetical protein